ncbi:MAG: DUF6491 family protein [Steroidobacteraceae bacterium]
MQPRIIATALIAAAAAALAGCASARGPSHATSSAAASREIAALPGRPACFRAADFDGSWITLNDSELIVPDRVFSRSYLIRLSEPVYDLRLRHRLGFEPFTPANGCICDGLSDFVLAAHSGLGGRVPIAAVRELNDSQERQLLSEHHIKPTAGLPTRGPGHPDNACPTL